VQAVKVNSVRCGLFQFLLREDFPFSFVKSLLDGKPEPDGIAQHSRELDGDIKREALLAAHENAQVLGRDFQPLGKVLLADPQAFDYFFDVVAGLNNSPLKREGFLGTSTDFSFRSF
jgi:hypothetical protein